jgi:hypothetical protein
VPTFLVIGPNVWGKGNTPDEAKQKAALLLGGSPFKLRKYMVFLVSEESAVDEYGMITTPMDEAGPIELYRVIDGKQVPALTPA